MRWIWLVVLCLSSCCLGAEFPGLRYLGDIGDLGITGNARTSVQFGRARVVWVNDHLSFQGRDDDGKTWEAVLPGGRGLGYSGVWQADFDHNSRPDLMIAAYSPKVGVCTLPVTLSFLLFNDHGQPVPWLIQTEAPSLDLPAIFADLNHNGRAELVVTSCEPPSGRPSAVLSITGIYEAKDAMWSLVKPDRLDPYIALIRRSHPLRPGLDQLLTPDPASWPDQGNRLGPDGSAPVQVTAVMKPSENCRGGRLPIVNGAVQRDWPNPCDDLKYNRIQLSDVRVCYDWPTVMLDDESGREIVAESEHPELLLQKIVDERRRVVLVGQRDLKRCSPVLLWAFRSLPEQLPSRPTQK